MEKPEKRVAILGSTGSIGTQSLMVCKSMGYHITALAANSNIQLLEQQVREFLPTVAVVADEKQYPALKLALADLDVKVEAGREAVCQAAALTQNQITINAIVGIAGLRPSLAALEAGIPLALSNKESLITGGRLVMETARTHGVPILPVDSEHSAVWQCLQAGRREDVKGMILTASGGPFFGKKSDELANASLEQALAHPNWSMGAKITIDSATLMNKGLEFIEAMWLFDLRPDQIEVVVHRQSVVHSAVEYVDGAVIAQLGVPDMRGAIQYALTYPERLPLGSRPLSLTDYGSLTFEKPDLQTFSCLAACIRAAEKGGLYPCAANGANEMAVELFRSGDIQFLQIGELVSAVVEELPCKTDWTLEAVEETDGHAREFVRRQVGRA